VYPVVQVLFPNNDAIFQDDNLPHTQHNTKYHNTHTHTHRSVQSWFEEPEDALQHHLWLAQSPNLNINEPLRSVLESRVRSSFPPSSLKQLERVVQYSTRDHSELAQVYSKKDTSCVRGKWLPNSILIKKCESFTAVSIIFVHPLYMLPSYMLLG
jgi:hypothetical protein